MNTLQAFELTKEFIKTIRNEKIRRKISSGATLWINADKFINKDELNSIFHFDATIRKICKLKDIVYFYMLDSEYVSFKKTEGYEG